MQPLPFVRARELVLATIPPAEAPLEEVDLGEAAGRVLARDVVADRPYPPFRRAIRDGFAVAAASFAGTARVVGEVPAGTRFARPIGSGEAVEIMTGAPLPDGADAVFMVEHAVREGENVSTERAVRPGDFVVDAGSECRAGAVAVEAGQKLSYASIAVLASIGATRLAVFSRPEVAIIPTGDELVDVDAQPEAFQIRNSNAWSLAEQVRRAGGTPRVLPAAKDQREHLLELINDGLRSDLLLLSGGVSAGKHDLVEHVLADLGAEFLFDRVLIQPGQPLVFGRVRDRFFFGLPGNPASTMVTFELFARAALDRLAGCREAALPLLFAQLTSEFRHKPGLTRFLPARVSADGRCVTPLCWQGSGDVFALARANAFLVAREDREVWAEGEMIEVLLQ